MIVIRQIWEHAGETDAIHLTLGAGDAKRHIKVTRSSNPAMYDFIREHGVLPTDPEQDPDPETRQADPDRIPSKNNTEPIPLQRGAGP